MPFLSTDILLSRYKTYQNVSVNLRLQKLHLESQQLKIRKISLLLLRKTVVIEYVCVTLRAQNPIINT